MKNKRQTATTWSRVRERIDQGETGDKKVAANPQRRRWVPMPGLEEHRPAASTSSARARPEQAGSAERAAA